MQAIWNGVYCCCKVIRYSRVYMIEVTLVTTFIFAVSEVHVTRQISLSSLGVHIHALWSKNSCEAINYELTLFLVEAAPMKKQPKCRQDVKLIFLRLWPRRCSALKLECKSEDEWFLFYTIENIQGFPSLELRFYSF